MWHENRSVTISNLVNEVGISFVQKPKLAAQNLNRQDKPEKSVPFLLNDKRNRISSQKSHDYVSALSMPSHI
jgi:hypothetical protein